MKYIAFSIIVLLIFICKNAVAGGPVEEKGTSLKVPEVVQQYY